MFEGKRAPIFAQQQEQQQLPWHPRPRNAGQICVNTLKRDWSADLTLGHVLQVNLFAPPSLPTLLASWDFTCGTLSTFVVFVCDFKFFLNFFTPSVAGLPSFVIDKDQNWWIRMSEGTNVGWQGWDPH